MFEFWKNLNVRQGMLITLLFAAVLTLFAIGFADLESGTETRAAGIAAEILDDGDWLLPKLNGSPFLEHPPLSCWITAFSFRLFGVNTFAARLPSALAALGIALLVYRFSIRCGYRPWCAAAASFVLCSSIQFFRSAASCGEGMLLAFFMFWAIYSFLVMTSEKALFRSIPAFISLLAALTGGAFTGGLSGILFPAAVIFIWTAWLDFLNKRFSLLRYIAIGAAAFTAFEVSGMWYYLLLRREGTETFYVALLLNNFGLTGGDPEPFYYYFVKLPLLFQPFLIFSLAGMLAILRDVRKRSFNDSQLLALSALLIPFAILCTIDRKSTANLLPLYAPLAILAAGILLRLPERWQSSLRQYIENFAANPMARHSAAAVLIAAFAVLAAMSGIGNFWIPLAGAAVVIAALAAGKAVIRYPAALLAVALLYPSVMAVYGSQTSERYNSLRPLFERCAELERAGYKIAIVSTPETTRGAAYYYLRHHVDLVETLQEGQKRPKTALIVRSEDGVFASERFNDRHCLVLTN